MSGECGERLVCWLEVNAILCRLSELCRNLDRCKLASDSNKSLVDSVHLKVSRSEWWIHTYIHVVCCFKAAVCTCCHTAARGAGEWLESCPI